MRRSDAVLARDARLTGWWEARAPRERALLGMLAAVALLAGLVILMVRPLAATRAQALLAIRTDAALEARLRAGAAAPAAPQGEGDVAAIVAASVARTGLVAGAPPVAMGRAAARVRVAGVAYEALVRLLADTSRAGLRVALLRVTPAAGAGLVDAELVLAR